MRLIYTIVFILTLLFSNLYVPKTKANGWQRIASVFLKTNPSNSQKALPSKEEIPERVTLVSPGDYDIHYTDSVDFAWNEAETTANHYWLELSLNEDMTEAYIDSLLTDTVTHLVFDVQNMDFWWRVKAGNDAGWGPYSELFKFTINKHDIKKYSGISAQRFYLGQNYPNPVRARTSIPFAIYDDSRVIIKLLSARGKELGVLINKKLESGVYSFVFHVDSLEPGIYYYNIHADSYKDTKKMVVLKEE